MERTIEKLQQTLQQYEEVRADVTIQLPAKFLDKYWDEDRNSHQYSMKQDCHDWLNRESGFWIFDENDVLVGIDPSKYLYRVRTGVDATYLDFFDSVLAVKFRLMYMSAETNPLM